MQGFAAKPLLPGGQLANVANCKNRTVKVHGPLPEMVLPAGQHGHVGHLWCQSLAFSGARLASAPVDVLMQCLLER
jgi:hypothetical protein